MVMNPLWIDYGSGPVQNPALTQDQFIAGMAAMQANNITLLRQAAMNLETKYISGSGIGQITKGVTMGKPMSLACEAWIESIWILYYSRVSQVTYQYNPALYDFSSCGPMPYSVPQLMAETGS